MHRWFDRRQRPPIGSRPGVIVVEEQGAPPPDIHVMRYGPSGLDEFDVEDLAQLADVRRPGHVVWVDVEHVSHAETLTRLGEIFDIHPLVLSDVAHVPQRIKSESYDGHEFIVTHMMWLEEAGLPVVGDDDDDDDGDERDADQHMLEIEQLSMVVGDGFVLTFQETPGDVLEPVRRRLRDSAGTRIRTSGSDYLAYALLDTVIDGYFPLIELLGETLERLDAEVFERPSDDLLEHINEVKHTILLVRRALWPQREALNRLVRDPITGFGDEVRVYFRDTYDHCVHLAEMIESQREFAAGLLSTYLTVVSIRTNDIMKVLTIIGSIFIPLTFLAGVYGMNFKYMPELEVWWAYPALLVVMALTAASLIAFFVHKGWILRRRRRRAPQRTLSSSAPGTPR